MDKLASVVGVTLGPKGRNVVLESKCVSLLLSCWLGCRELLRPGALLVTCSAAGDAAAAANLASLPASLLPPMLRLPTPPPLLLLLLLTPQTPQPPITHHHHHRPIKQVRLS